MSRAPLQAPAGWALPLLILVLGGGLPERIEAQRSCQVVSSDSVQVVTLFMGTRLIYAVRPDVECDDGTRVQADSAEVNEGAGISRFFGNVRFRDPTRSLTSGFAEFYEHQDRLLAWDDVVLIQEAEGTVIRGDTLEYYRAGTFLQEDMLSMRGRRVRSSLPPRGVGGEPYRVESDRLVIQGEDRVTAIGMVSVERDSLRAWGDTMTFNPDTDRLRLAGLARVEGEDYELRARVIDLLVPGDTLREVLAQTDAVLTTEGMVLSAPREIRIHLEDGNIRRLVAVDRLPVEGPAPVPDPGAESPLPDRPRAEAEEFVVVGDSLDIDAPGGELRRVVASGRARGESLREPVSEADRAARDSLPEPLRRDWMEGDTIVATFVTVDEVSEETPSRDLVPDVPPPDPLPPGGVPSPPGEGSREPRYRLDRLVAIGNARSLYRLAPSDSLEAERGVRALHYVRGREITVILAAGEVERMEVEDPVGLHLEPRRRGPDAPRPEPMQGEAPVPGGGESA